MDIKIFYDNNSLNKNKLRESWFNKYHHDEYLHVKEFQDNNNLSEIKFSQVLYSYINNLEIPLCDFCEIKNKRFIGFQNGYDRFCSKKCASSYSLPKSVETRRNNTILKYGVTHTSKLQFVKDKQEKTNISKYGFKSPTLNPDIKNKQTNTMLSKYGVKFTGNSDELMSKVFSSRFENYKKLIYENYKKLNIINIIEEGLIEIKCERCNNNYIIRNELLRLRFFRYNVNTCLYCNPLNMYKDTKENEVRDFIVNSGVCIVNSDRRILNGKEIDIYLPDHKIGIEFNGLYWHSDLHKDKKYHIDKKNNCLKNDINLIHIWEDDWLYKEEIVKSRISNILNLNQYRIMARKCILKEVSSKDAKKFLDENHLQGNINSSYRIGLYFNNELVSIMTFGKLRRSLGNVNLNNSWELYRFCSKLNTNVIGSFSKLLKSFEINNTPKSLLTYANRDWSYNDNIYHKNGFEFKGNTEINYWYFNNDIKRKHRYQFRKDKLVKDGFDRNKTEVEIMRDRGYHRIFDCGSLKYIKEY